LFCLFLFFFEGQFCHIENLVKSTQKIDQNSHLKKFQIVWLKRKHWQSLFFNFFITFFYEFLYRPEQNLGSICENFAKKICIHIFLNFLEETEERLFTILVNLFWIKTWR